MKVIKIISAVFAGTAVSIFLYCASIFLIVKPLQASSGREPEAFMGLTFIILMPACLFLGSLISGFLLNALETKLSFRKAVLLSPGLYYGVFTLVPILFRAGSLIAGFVVFMAIASGVAIVASTAGTFLGSAIRKKTSNPIS